MCACVCMSVSLLKYLYNKVVADDGVGSRSRSGRLPAQLRFSFSCTCRKLVLLRRAAWAAAWEAWHANLAHYIWPVGLLADWLVGWFEVCKQLKSAGLVRVASAELINKSTRQILAIVTGDI